MLNKTRIFFIILPFVLAACSFSQPQTNTTQPPRTAGSSTPVATSPSVPAQVS